jgi:hypothetical protein
VIGRGGEMMMGRYVRLAKKKERAILQRFSRLRRAAKHRTSNWEKVKKQRKVDFNEHSRVESNREFRLRPLRPSPLREGGIRRGIIFRPKIDLSINAILLDSIS